jgi:hypothetical protein
LSLVVAARSSFADWPDAACKSTLVGSDIPSNVQVQRSPRSGPQKRQRSRHHAAASPNTAFDNIARDAVPFDVSNRLAKGRDTLRAGHRVGAHVGDDVIYPLGLVWKYPLGLVWKPRQIHGLGWKAPKIKPYETESRLYKLSEYHRWEPSSIHRIYRPARWYAR